MEESLKRITRKSRLSVMNLLNGDAVASLMASGVKTVGDLIALDRTAIYSLSIPFDQRVQTLVARNEALGHFDETFVPFKTSMGFHNDAEAVLALMDYREKALAAAKKLGKKTLFNSLVVTTIDAAFSIYDNMGFYAGKYRIGLNESPAAIMASEKGVIKLWGMAAKDPIALADSINDEDRINTLSVVHGLLEIFLNTMVENDDLGRILIDGNEPITYSIESIKKSKTDDQMKETCAYAREAFENAGLFLKARQMQLSLKEHEAYDKNPDWEHPVYETEQNGPFDGRAARQRCSKELHLHAKKYPNSLRRLAEVSSALDRVDREYITAFHLSSIDISSEMVELMAMPLSVTFKDEAAEIVLEDPLTGGVEFVSPWLMEEWKHFCTRMMKYLNERIDSVPKGCEAKTLWAETFAQFLEGRNGSVFWFQFTEDAAQKFVEVANKAARREWVENRIMYGSNKMVKSSAEGIVVGVQQVVSEPTRDAIANGIKQGFEKLMFDHAASFRYPKPPLKRKVRKHGTPGRKKSEIKEEQVAQGLKWLKKNSGKNPSDAAKYVLGTLKLARTRWKEGGYEGKSACASLAQAIGRCLSAAAK